MKKIVLSVVLLTALLVFLTACGVSDSDTPPQNTTAGNSLQTTVNQPPQDTTAGNSLQTTVNQPSQQPIDTQHKKILNYCPLRLDMPPVLGKTDLTSLAKAVVNTSAPNEIMYFLVYVHEPLPDDYDHTANRLAYYDYEYQGKTIREWLDNVEKINAQLSNLESKLRNEGMPQSQIELNEQYLELYDNLVYLSEQLTYAQAEQYFYANNKNISKYTEFFEQQGFAIIGDINDSYWQRRWYCSTLISDWYIMFAVAGTSDNIAQLSENNDKYHIWLSASDRDGHWIEANIGYKLSGDIGDSIADYFIGHIYYSYQELGLYERLWYIEE